MSRLRSTFPYVEGARRSVEWYAARPGTGGSPHVGERIFIVCEGGSSTSRLEVFPPRLELDERDGVYVLEDDGPVDDWRYVFVPRRP